MKEPRFSTEIIALPQCHISSSSTCGATGAKLKGLGGTLSVWVKLVAGTGFWLPAWSL